MNLPELGWGYVRVVPSKEVAEEGEVIHLPALIFGHVGAFIVKRTRVPPLLSEGGSSPRAHLRGVHRHFLVSLSLCGGLLGRRRGGGRVSWGPALAYHPRRLSWFGSTFWDSGRRCVRDWERP